MKYLLKILGSITLGASASTPILENTLSNRHNPIDKSQVNSEFQESYKQMELLNLRNVNSLSDDELITSFTDILLAFKDISNEDFYRRYIDLSWNAYNKFSQRLENIKFEEICYKNIVNEELRKAENEAQIKFNSSINKEFYEYIKAKEDEAKLYFELYDEIISKEMLGASIKQNDVNELINLNEKLDEELTGLGARNEIHDSIIKVLKETERLLKIFKKQFDEAYLKMSSSYDATSRMRESSWRGWIPFVGTVYAKNYKKQFQRTLEEIKVYATAFGKDEALGEQIKEFTDKSLNAMKEISESVEDQGLFELIVQETGIDKDFEGFAGAEALIMSQIDNATGGVWDKMNSFLGIILGGGFMVSQLDDEFDNSLTKNFQKIKDMTDKVKDNIDNTHNQLTNNLKNERANIAANNVKMEEINAEIDKNSSQIEILNKEIENSQFIKEELNNELITTGSKLAASGHLYNWYFERMTVKNSRSIKQTSNELLETRLKDYEKSIELENEKFDILINKINDSSLSEAFKEQLNNDHKIIYSENSKMFEKLKKIIN